MKKIAAIAVSIAMVAMAAPATATTTDDYREENRAFLMEKLGDEYDPNAIVEVTVNGHTEKMEASEAVELWLDQTERVNVADIANSDGHGTPTAGDIWLVNLFSCIEPDTQEDTPVPALQPDPQLYVYEGGLIQGEAPSGTSFLAWTEGKSVGDASGLTYAGQGSTLCINFFFLEIGLAFYDGVLA